MSARKGTRARGKARRRLVGIAVGLLVGLPLGVAAATVPGHHPEPPTLAERNQEELAAAAQAEPGDRLRAAADEVAKDGFHVAPELEGVLTDAEERRIEQVVAASEVPLFVVWWDRTTEGGYYIAPDAFVQLQATVGEEGYYAVVERGGLAQVAAIGYDDPYVDITVRGRPAASLTRFVEELSAVPPERPRERGPRSDYWGGSGGGIAAGLLMVAVGYPVALAVVGIAGTVRSRRKGAV